VRYADDFLLLCRSVSGAEGALHKMRNLLAEHGLVLNPEKTRIVPFDRSFRFLGHLFARTLAVEVRAEGESPPDMESDPAVQPHEAPLAAPFTARRSSVDLAPGLRVLYLMEPDRLLDAEHEAFVVRQGEGRLLAMHRTQVDRIEIGPHASASDAAIRLALASAIPLAYVNGAGATLGFLCGPIDDGAPLHLAQARHTLDPMLRFDLARHLVEGRIRNQRAQLNRLNRRRKDAAVAQTIEGLGRALTKLSLRRDIAGLMGIEGAATAIYWRALARCLEQGWVLTRRRRRPPPDPVNLAISFLAHLLYRDITALLLRHGLHPGIGTLHAAHDGHPACASDLIEEFRAALVEGLAVYLFNNRILKPEMFGVELDGSCRIDSDGRRAIIRGYEAKLYGEVRSPRSGERLRWRRLIEEQIQAYRDHMLGRAFYQPYGMDY